MSQISAQVFTKQHRAETPCSLPKPSSRMTKPQELQGSGQRSRRVEPGLGVGFVIADERGRLSDAPFIIAASSPCADAVLDPPPLSECSGKPRQLRGVSPFQRNGASERQGRLPRLTEAEGQSPEFHLVCLAPKPGHLSKVLP